MNFFLPVHGTNFKKLDAYNFYSSITAASNLGTPLVNNKEATLDMIQERIAQYKELQPYFYEDYYPLTGISNLTGARKWLAYQLYRPSDNTGIVIAFRHCENKKEIKSFSLKGISPNKSYYILNEESKEMKIVKGDELSSNFSIFIADSPGVVLYKYGQIDNY